MVRIPTFILFLFLTLVMGPVWAGWSDPPLVNTIQAASGAVNLNFGMPGSRQQIAIFVLNSNDPAGFHVNFTFANKGMFKSGARQFSLTNVALNPLGGTLGTDLIPPANLALTVDAGTGIATWSPSGGPPSGATDNYIIAIYADWADQSGLLAGFYLENISAVVVSGP